MIDEILQRRPKKHTPDLNIVPILDMLTTVIFFLLMSTTFIEYTKLTVPPAKTVTTTASSDVAPISPRLLITSTGVDAYSFKLVWSGKSPGETVVQAKEAEMVDKVTEELKKFTAKYPSEKTLQVSLDRTVKYQVLINVMDSSRDIMPDVVLLSYAEVNR